MPGCCSSVCMQTFQSPPTFLFDSKPATVTGCLLACPCPAQHLPSLLILELPDLLLLLLLLPPLSRPGSTNSFSASLFEHLPLSLSATHHLPALFPQSSFPASAFGFSSLSTPSSLLDSSSIDSASLRITAGPYTALTCIPPPPSTLLFLIRRRSSLLRCLNAIFLPSRSSLTCFHLRPPSIILLPYSSNLILISDAPLRGASIHSAFSASSFDKVSFKSIRFHGCRFHRWPPSPLTTSPRSPIQYIP